MPKIGQGVQDFALIMPKIESHFYIRHDICHLHNMLQYVERRIASVFYQVFCIGIYGSDQVFVFMKVECGQSWV